MPKIANEEKYAEGALLGGMKPKWMQRAKQVQPSAKPIPVYKPPKGASTGTPALKKFKR